MKRNLSWLFFSSVIASQALAQAPPQVLAQRADASASTLISSGRALLTTSDGYQSSMIHITLRGVNYRTFGEVGVHFQLSAPIALGPGVTVDRGKREEISRRALEMLRDDPRVYVILWLSLDPTKAWREANPDHCVLQEATGRGAYASMGSRKYREAAKTNLAALAAFLNSNSVAKVVVGFHLSAAGDGQFYINKPNVGQLDYSPGNHEDFRLWLGEQYRHDLARLCVAWGEPSARFDTAALLKDSDIPAVAGNYLHENVGRERHAMDVLRFNRAAAPTRLAKDFTQTLKSAMRKPVLVTCWHEDAIYGRIYSSFGVSDLISGSNRVDIVTATTEYGTPRQWGHPGRLDGVWSSNFLRNQVRLMEWDLRPFGAPSYGGDRNFPESMEEFRMQLLRDAGCAAARGLCGWFYDMGDLYPQGGQAEAIAREAAAIMNWAHRAEAPVTRNDVAVFVDEEAGWRHAAHVIYDTTRAYGTIESPQEAWSDIKHTQRDLRDSLNTSGIPYDSYYLQDLAHARLPDYRMCVLLLSTTIGKPQVSAIQTRVQRAGKTLVVVTVGENGVPGRGSPDYYDKTAALIREIAHRAAVPVFSTMESDATYIGSHVLAIHTREGGRRTLHLPRRANVNDLIHNHRLADQVTDFDIELPPRSTTVLGWDE